MAKYSMDFPDDMLKSLIDGSFDEIARDGLNQATPYLKETMQNALSQHGDLGKSVKVHKAKKMKTDAWISMVNVSGTGKDGKSNSLKAMWLEYGTKKKGKGGSQPMRPWLANATNSAEDRVLETLQRIYEEKIK